MSIIGMKMPVLLDLVTILQENNKKKKKKKKIYLPPLQILLLFTVQHIFVKRLSFQFIYISVQVKTSNS